MNTLPVIGKITERGQITLPKRFRSAATFRGAHAVEFVEQRDSLIIRPIKTVPPQDDHTALLDHTMRDWAAPEHDNLFDFTKAK